MNSLTNNGNQSDLAKRLLCSSDVKVAAAAKRIFSSPPPSTAALPTGFRAHTNQGSVLTTAALVQVNCAIPEYKSIQPSVGIPSDVQEAASAVVMLAPQHHRHINRTNNLATQIGPVLQPINSMLLPLPAAPVASQELNHSGLVMTSNQEMAKKQNPTERLKRSRERNRMHARKTRQRKKEHMQLLQNRAEDLKREQIRLKQVINEKNTASILACMFATSTAEPSESNTDSKVEELLRRPSDEIPDVSRIAELPALILPGQHSKRRILGQSTESDSQQTPQEQYPDDGIDYQLLGKDRSKCTAGELDKIRKERNRMHAKRTRDRKRIFMEEMEDIIRQLQNENKLLQDHIQGTLNNSMAQSYEYTPRATVSPSLGSENSSVKPVVVSSSNMIPSNEQLQNPNSNNLDDLSATENKQSPVPVTTDGREVYNEAESLLSLGKGTCEKRKFDGMTSTSSAVSLSSGPSGQQSMQSEDHQSSQSEYSSGYLPPKKLCMKKYLFEMNKFKSSQLPSSITTTVQM